MVSRAIDSRSMIVFSPKSPPQPLLTSSRTRFLLPYFPFEGRKPRKFKLESSEKTRKKTKMKKPAADPPPPIWLFQKQSSAWNMKTWLEPRRRFSKSKESEIEGVCRAHYQNFITAIDNLRSLLSDVDSLKSSLYDSNSQLHNVVVPLLMVLALQYAATEMANGSYLVHHFKKVDGERLVIWISYYPGHSFGINDILLLWKITRLFENGVECRGALDAILDRCSALQNIRQAVLQYRQLFNQQHMEPRERQVALNRGAEFLERYFRLIAFSAYLGSGESNIKMKDGWYQKTFHLILIHLSLYVSDSDEIKDAEGSGEYEDEEVVILLKNMKTCLERRPRGFGEGKVYDTNVVSCNLAVCCCSKDHAALQLSPEFSSPSQEGRRILADLRRRAKQSLIEPMKTIDGHQVVCKLTTDNKKQKPNVGPQGGGMVSQLANVNNLKDIPVKLNSQKETNKKDKVPAPIVDGFEVCLVNLSKKKKVHKDLRVDFQGVAGVVNIVPKEEEDDDRLLFVRSWTAVHGLSLLIKKIQESRFHMLREKLCLVMNSEAYVD